METPTPPWRTTRKPRRRQLTQDAIVGAGLRIVVEEGLDQVSMRAVAQALDTGPASLYAHVANKDELLELMLERVLGELELPELDASRWQEQIRQVMRESRRVMTKYSDIAKVALINIPTGPNGLRIAEFMFRLLLEAGFSPQEASLGLDRFSLYVAGDAYEGSLHHGRQRAGGLSQEEYFQQFFGMIQAYYRQLSPEQYPAMTAHIDTLMSDGDEERFEFGLDLLIAGMEARLRS
ncbi:TetR/AcrR family transcriptional regulator [Nonomuraea sp. NPDC050663]|uniref:TetR/AcrR family transcriptional regulator n=1 Tax=Nonomuraea sp. NPDC050663 TaxID=3364370 RepID=UPI00378BC454